MDNRIFIHYGHKEFSKSSFGTVRNRRFIKKPEGGLWASDINARYGWLQWAEENDFFQPFRFSSSFKFSLSPKARIYVINSSRDAERLPRREPDQTEFGINITYPVLPDFEKIKLDYDVIDFRISEDKSLYHTMYAWDCDSILVLNPDVVVPVSDGTEEKDMEERDKISSVLSARELSILKDHYGKEDRLRLDQIAEKHHLTRERVRQIEAVALRKLKEEQNRRRKKDA